MKFLCSLDTIKVNFTNYMNASRMFASRKVNQVLCQPMASFPSNVTGIEHSPIFCIAPDESILFYRSDHEFSF